MEKRPIVTMMMLDSGWRSICEGLTHTLMIFHKLKE